MSDGRSDVVVLRVRVLPADIAFVKFVFESYEGIAVVRTLDRKSADLELLVAPDFAEAARAILESLRPEVAWQPLGDPETR